MRNLLSKILLCTAVSFVFLSAVSGQTVPDDSDFQQWNDLQITHPLTKKLDLFTVTTLRFGGDLTNVNSTRFGVGVTAKPVKHFSVTPFVTFISDRRSNGRLRYEYRFAVRGVYSHQIGPVNISHRSQIEYRIRPGDNTWRYRPSVTVEKKLPESWVRGLRLYVSDEPFYDSASGYFSRNRISGGVIKSLTKKLSLDVYFLHQGDNFTTPGTVNVLGTTVRLSL